MAFTKVVGAGIHTLSNIASHNINSSGIITATKFVGPMENGSGISTFYDLKVTNNLTVEGTTTTLDTKLVEVDKIEVEADSTNVAIAVTQTGSGDLLRLYDGTSQVVTIDDEGQVGINTTGIGALVDVVAKSTNSVLARFKAFNKNSNFDIQTDASSHGQAYVRNNIGAAKVQLNSNGASYFTGGDVGIGTESPTKDFEVYRNGLANAKIKGNVSGGLGAELILQNANAAANGYSEIQFQDAGTNVFSKIRGFNLTDGSNNGYMALYTASATEGLKERVRISDAGKVGIGTITPQAIFHIEDATPGIRLSDTGNAGAFAYFDANAANAIIHADKGNDVADSRVAFAVDNSEKVRINSDGDVLINTQTNPTADIKLLVAGNGGVSSGSYFSFRGDYGNVSEPAAYAIKYDSSLTNLSGAGGLHQYAYGGISFNLGGQDRVNFKTTGEVGIGTNDPSNYGGAVKLALYNTGHTGLTIAAGTITSDSNIFFADGIVGDATYRGNIKYAHDGDSMRFHTAADERLRITSSGKVGIGTDNPQKKLEVYDGDIYLNSTDKKIFLTSDYDQYITANAASNYMVFAAGNQERLRIASDGKVGIGTDLTTTPSSTLTVSPHTTGGRNISIYTNGTVGHKAGLFFNATSGTGNLAEIQAEYKGTNSGDLIFNTSMGERLRIASDGKVGINTTVVPYGNFAVDHGQYGLTRISDYSHILVQNKNASTTEFWNFAPRDDGSVSIGRGVPSGTGIITDKKLSIDSSGDVKVVSRGSSTSGAPFYVAVTGKSSITYAGGSDDTACLRVVDNGSTNSYYHGIELRGKQGGDVRLYCQDGGSDVADFVIATDNSGITERLRIKSTGEVHISDRNSATAGEHILQGGSFGIRMQDTGGYNRWNIERNYGGWQSTPLVHLSAQGRVGINQGSPDHTLDVIGDDSTKSIECTHGIKIVTKTDGNKRFQSGSGISYISDSLTTSDNTWYTVAILRYSSGSFTCVVGDAAVRNIMTGHFCLTNPAYGVSVFSKKESSGSWNSGSSDIQIVNSGSDMAFQVKHDSYYNDSNSAGVYLILNQCY